MALSEDGGGETGVHAVSRVAESLERQGRIDEAIDTYRMWADAGNEHCARQPAALLGRHGRVVLLRGRAAAGDGPSAVRLSELLKGLGDGMAATVLAGIRRNGPGQR